MVRDGSRGGNAAGAGCQVSAREVFQIQNAKTIKGESLGYTTLIRYLAPGNVSGYEVCASRGACSDTCLFTSGRAAVFPAIIESRIAKTWERFHIREEHFSKMRREILNAEKRARLMGHKIAVRVNGTSDLTGDALTLAREFPHVQFYDYTKHLQVALRRDTLPSNYHVTLSHDPVSVPESDCRDALAMGVNVAVVFDTKRNENLPSRCWGSRVIDGDLHDLRFLDPQGKRGVIVGLRAKGEAKGDNSGFVVKAGDL